MEQFDRSDARARLLITNTLPGLSGLEQGRKSRYSLGVAEAIIDLIRAWRISGQESKTGHIPADHVVQNADIWSCVTDERPKGFMARTEDHVNTLPTNAKFAGHESGVGV